MHAIKGGWVGQTFALAKRNESEGRKSRIRRSKEERKEMVESFIKKYQRLNNGNFPSLNLTNKEVGGSFYTVREIVREIIQENRVLGPSKLLLEEHSADQLLEQYPLGTISTEPQTSFISQNGSSVLLDQHQSTVEELDVIFDRYSAQPEQKGFDKGQIINGSHVVEESKQSDKSKIAEVLVSELVETKKGTEHMTASKVTKMEDVIVEIFPVRPVARPTDYLDGTSVAKNGNLETKEVEVHVAPSDDTLPDGISSSTNDKVAETPASPLLENKLDLVDEKASENLVDPQPKSSISSATIEGIVHDLEVGIDVDVKASHNDKATAETWVANASSGIQTKTVNGADATTGSSKSITQEVAIENKASQRSDSHEKGSNATLNRINLESWQGASKNPAKPEANPIWAIFKAFIVAFVKFWTE